MIIIDFSKLQIEDLNENKLENPILKGNLNKFSYISESIYIYIYNIYIYIYKYIDDRIFSEISGSIIFYGCLGILTVGIASALLFGFGLGIMFSFVSMLQLLCLIPTMSLNLPNNLLYFINNYLRWANFRFSYFNNFLNKIGVINLNSVNNQALSKYLAENDYSSKSILVNYGGQIFLLLIIFSLYPLFRLGFKLTKLNIFKIVSKAYEYRIPLMAANLAYVEFSVVSMISLFQVGYIFINILI